MKVGDSLIPLAQPAVGDADTPVGYGWVRLERNGDLRLRNAFLILAGLVSQTRIIKRDKILKSLKVGNGVVNLRRFGGHKKIRLHGTDTDRPLF